MSKFNQGNKVRVTKGVHEGLEGVVTDPWWQVSQSDWPRVEFTTEDGMYFYADEDEMELTEDPYEYAATWLDWKGDHFPIEEGEWGTLEVAEREAEFVGRTKAMSGIKIMRRLKAGEPEDYNV